ncbi:MAG: PD40 domain-containing protein, partial [Candidatus Solibacter usitatus]|nr:PD40 domain-containing protein [Candidatus Solibacter usitatus]
AFPLLENVVSNSIRGHALYDTSRAGTMVYFRGAGIDREGNGLEWLDATGRSTPIPGLGGAFSPRLSPDGKRVAYFERDGRVTTLWVYDLQRNAKGKLTFEENPLSFAWTPDSRAILFSAGNKLYWTRADGASKPQQVLEDTESMWVYDISPDGRLLAMQKHASVLLLAKLEYTGTPSGDVAPRVGKTEKCCEERSPSFVGGGRFSPDGKWISYHSTDTTNFQVYVRAVPDSGAKWQVSAAGGGGASQWVPNSRQMYFRTPNSIMVVDYSANGSAFVPGTPRVWLERRIAGRYSVGNISVAADGKRMVVVSTGGTENDASPQATIIFNLFEEVRRRALANGQ